MGVTPVLLLTRGGGTTVLVLVEGRDEGEQWRSDWGTPHSPPLPAPLVNRRQTENITSPSYYVRGR